MPPVAPGPARRVRAAATSTRSVRARVSSALPRRRGHQVPVAEAADGLDARADRTELAPQVADVESDLVGRGRMWVVPHALEQLLVAEHLTRMIDERAQEPELQRGERELTSVRADAMLAVVDRQNVVLIALGRGRRARTPQQRLHAR